MMDDRYKRATLFHPVTNDASNNFLCLNTNERKAATIQYASWQHTQTLQYRHEYLLAQSYKATRETLIQQLTSCNLFEVFPMVFPLEYNNSTRTDNSHNVGMPSFIPFRLTGSKQYGYSTDEIERDLRIDLHQMNIDCADAINASVPNHMSYTAPQPQGTGTQTQPSVVGGGRKAFLAYTTLDCPVVDETNTNTNPASHGDWSNNRITVLCYPVPEPDDRSTDGSLSLPHTPVGHNMDVVLDIAKQTLLTYFRNVQVCKCGV